MILFTLKHTCTDLICPSLPLFSLGNSIKVTEPGTDDTYAVIPDNFTLTAATTTASTMLSSNEHSPMTPASRRSLPTANNTTAATAAATMLARTEIQYTLPGDYEIIDLDPLPIPTVSTTKQTAAVTAVVTATAGGESSFVLPARQHQYDIILNEVEDDNGRKVNYNRLQRAGSKSRQASSSTTSTASVSPVVPPSPAPHPRGGITTPTSPPSANTREGDIFDNPEYSQLDRSAVGSATRKHVDIYKTASSDESNRSGGGGGGGGGGGMGNWNGMVPASPVPGKDNDYHQDASVFVVNGLALDETTASPSQGGGSELPTITGGHYTTLQPDSMSAETSYAQPIVSDSEKYVSERGHLYQVLDGRGGGGGDGHLYQVLDGSEGEGEDGHLYHVLDGREGGGGEGGEGTEDKFSFVVANLDALEKEAPDNMKTSVYHSLMRGSPASDCSSECMPAAALAGGGRGNGSNSRTGYNVIDRSPQQQHVAAGGSRSLSLDCGGSSTGDAPYDVVDRRISEGNFSGQPPPQYDVIDMPAYASTSQQAVGCVASIPANSSYSVLVRGNADSASTQRPLSVKVGTPSFSHQPAPPSYSSLMDTRLDPAHPFLLHPDTGCEARGE